MTFDWVTVTESGTRYHHTFLNPGDTGENHSCHCLSRSHRHCSISCQPKNEVRTLQTPHNQACFVWDTKTSTSSHNCRFHTRIRPAAQNGSLVIGMENKLLRQNSQAENLKRTPRQEKIWKWNHHTPKKWKWEHNQQKRWWLIIRESIVGASQERVSATRTREPSGSEEASGGWRASQAAEARAESSQSVTVRVQHHEHSGQYRVIAIHRRHNTKVSDGLLGT